MKRSVVIWNMPLFSSFGVVLYSIVTVPAGAYLPIIFIYLSTPAICNDPLRYARPHKFGYGRFALEQAILTQPSNTVLLASNFGMCGRFATQVSTIKGLRMVDTAHFISQRTRMYMNLSRRIISVDNDTELFLTSAQRFFVLEDVMTSLRYPEAFHLELDNMLYEKISNHISVLRGSYTTLAATPLSHPNYGLTTASVFWVPRVDLLEKFNTFLLKLADKGTEWMSYINWSRNHGGCCKRKGGLYSRKDGGGGLRPFFISEMSMLTYYREVHEDTTLFSFPILPFCGLYPTNRFVQNSTEYAVRGRKVGPPLGDNIFDPGSYGQFLGGTHHTNPKPGFTDGSHIIGQAIRMSNGLSAECVVEVRCKARTSPTESYPFNNSSCMTAPHVRCKQTQPWVPLLNLHVHNKKTEMYSSRACSCG